MNLGEGSGGTDLGEARVQRGRFRREVQMYRFRGGVQSCTYWEGTNGQI